MIRTNERTDDGISLAFTPNGIRNKTTVETKRTKKKKNNNERAITSDQREIERENKLRRFFKK
jgi:hypothetical protein